MRTIDESRAALRKAVPILAGAGDETIYSLDKLREQIDELQAFVDGVILALKGKLPNVEADVQGGKANRLDALVESYLDKIEQRTGVRPTL